LEGTLCNETEAAMLQREVTAFAGLLAIFEAADKIKLQTLVV
jgi:hypothetical protein